MKIINSSNIPEPVFRALCANWYSGEKEERDFSITEILNPTRLNILKKRYYDQIEVDAMSRFWAMLGSSMHNILEVGIKKYEDFMRSEGKFEKDLGLKFVAEKRFASIFNNDILVSGGCDIYDPNTQTIYDYKYQTVFNWVNISDKIEDLTFQLNGYRILFQRNGYRVKNMSVIFIFRDFRPYEINRYKDYPTEKIKELSIRDMPDEEFFEILEKKYHEKIMYESLPDSELPLCTKKEMWQGDDQYKVYSSSGKCVKIYDNLDDANNHADKDGYYVKKFIQEPKRCGQYCDASSVCDQWKKIKEELDEQDRI